MKAGICGKEARRFLFILLLFLFCASYSLEVYSNDKVVSDADEVMNDVWYYFAPPGLNTEIEYSIMTSTNWTSQKKYSTRWTKYNENELMLILNKTKKHKHKPDGVLLKDSGSDFGFLIYVQKRKKIKSKSGDYNNKSNGTELNYIDLSRLFGENTDKFSYSYWDGDINEQLKGLNIETSIKCVPKQSNYDDYSFRIFHISYLKTSESKRIPAIRGVEYFCNNELCKVQINHDIKWHEDYLLWRVIRMSLISFNDGKLKGKTTFELLERVFNEPIGKLNKNALSNGNVR